MTRLLDIFNAAMAHPKGSDEREAGLAELGEAIMANARGGPAEDMMAGLARAAQAQGVDDYDDWAKRAAGDTDEE